MLSIPYTFDNRSQDDNDYFVKALLGHIRDLFENYYDVDIKDNTTRITCKTNKNGCAVYSCRITGFKNSNVLRIWIANLFISIPLIKQFSIENDGVCITPYEPDECVKILKEKEEEEEEKRNNTNRRPADEKPMRHMDREPKYVIERDEHDEHDEHDEDDERDKYDEDDVHDKYDKYDA